MIILSNKFNTVKRYGFHLISLCLGKVATYLFGNWDSVLCLKELLKPLIFCKYIQIIDKQTQIFAQIFYIHFRRRYNINWYQYQNN